MKNESGRNPAFVMLIKLFEKYIICGIIVKNNIVIKI